MDKDSRFSADGKIINPDTPYDFKGRRVIRVGTGFSDDEAINKGQLTSLWPVGSVFLSVVVTNPATLLGFGTWVRIAEGQMLTGFKTADPDFGTLEGTGGAKTVTHDHNHDGAAVSAHTGAAVDPHGGAAANDGVGAAIQIFDLAADLAHTVTQPAAHTVTQPTAHSNHTIINPYFVIYVWKRTA